MNIYDFTEPRPFLREWIDSQPKHGRGILRNWSLHLRVHPTLFSQILSGKRHLTLELAEQLGDQMRLSENEVDYLLMLVMHEQAGTQRLKKRLMKKIAEAQTKAKRIGERVNVSHEMTDADRAEFYSSWHFSGVRNLTAIEGMQTTEAIVRHLSLPKSLVENVVDFLLKSGLCVMEGGKLQVGPLRTYIPPSSPIVQRHHQNWRMHGFSKMPLRREDDLFLTFPMSLSEEDAEKIRKLLPAWVEEVNKIVVPSKSETVRCLNMDFFSY